jgi:hypothetical protein
MEFEGKQGKRHLGLIMAKFDVSFWEQLNQEYQVPTLIYPKLSLLTIIK